MSDLEKLLAHVAQVIAEDRAALGDAPGRRERDARRVARVRADAVAAVADRPTTP